MRGGAGRGDPAAGLPENRKEFYTVQTAASTWAYFNWFTFQKSPPEVLERFRNVVAEAFAELAGDLERRATRYGEMVGRPARVVPVEPKVYTYGELAAHVKAKLGPEVEAKLAEQVMQEPGIDLRTFSCRMTEGLWSVAGLPAPAAVVGFAQVYIPPVRLDVEAPLMQAALAALRQNSPGWGRLYRIDHEAHARLNLPVINIGPYGEGAHSRTERVERAFSFSVVPELIWRTLDQVGGG